MFKNRSRIFAYILLGWMLLIGLVLLVSMHEINNDVTDLAITEARANFNKDVAIRHWAAQHGGVYVKVDSLTNPNPNLSHVPERDITTPLGKELTLMNPAYMVRQLNEHFADYYGVVGHITSVKLLRPENKPDEWERNALAQFEDGKEEVSEFTSINNEPFFRLMQPMYTQQSCLKCHSHQGYKVGDIRGGVSVSVPISSYIEMASHHRRINLSAFFIIWILGVGGISISYRSINKSIKVQEIIEKELKNTNKELTISKVKAEKSDKLKTEFINNMSHEIRTPMNGIVGFSELLKKANLAKEKQDYYTSLIIKNSHQLLYIIDEILETSDLGSKSIQLNENEICLNVKLEEVVSVFQKRVEEKGLQLRLVKNETDDNSIIITDELRLSIIVNNIVDNALKYTKKEGSIEVGYRFCASETIMYVKDTGVGVKPENQELIFQRFQQERRGVTSNAGGLGLGLAISKESADLIGAKITLSSEVGKGTTFFIHIPQKNKVNADVKSLVPDPENANFKALYKILIVEDEFTNFELLNSILHEVNQFNVHVTHVENGKDAVDLIEQNKQYDLVFMDLKMPVMDGFEATKRIKKRLPSIPIIVQTAYVTKVEIDKAFRAGCDDYLPKPISEEILLPLLMKYLKIS